MKNLLIDTNVILDLLAKRENFYKDAIQIFSLADTNQVVLKVSALSFANVYYILRNSLKIQDVSTILRKFKVLVTTVSLSDKIIELALHDLEFNDFEDAIQYYSATETQCEFIVTRNVKDFKGSKIVAMTPTEFLTVFKSNAD